MMPSSSQHDTQASSEISGNFRRGAPLQQAKISRYLGENSSVSGTLVQTASRKPHKPLFRPSTLGYLVLHVLEATDTARTAAIINILTWLLRSDKPSSRQAVRA